MTGIRADLCVVGGGPAGAGFALRMAQLGHDVVLVERERFPRPRVGESLVPAILPLFEVLGIRGQIEDAAFLRPGGTILQWSRSTEYHLRMRRWRSRATARPRAMPLPFTHAPLGAPIARRSRSGQARSGTSAWGKIRRRQASTRE